MPLIMNASSIEQTVKVHGAWFSFKPKQIKTMAEEKVFFLSSSCAYLGFVSVPEELEDLDIRASKEGQAKIKEAEERGIANRVQFLERLKHNELSSLQRDYDLRNDKSDPRVLVSKEMLKNFEELVTYKNKKQDMAQEQVNRIKELEKLLEE